MSTRRMREDLAAVEAALASLNPTPCSVDRDQMMYQAGVASAEKTSPSAPGQWSSWLWPCGTAATTLLAVTFASLWLASIDRQIAEREVEPPRAGEVEKQEAGEHPAAVARSAQVARDGERFRTDYLALRRLLLSKGVDALKQPAPMRPPDAESSGWRSGDRRALRELLEG